MAASQSPAFPIGISLGAPGPSLVPQMNVGVPGAMARLQLTQQQSIEKTRISMCVYKGKFHNFPKYNIYFLKCLLSVILIYILNKY